VSENPWSHCVSGPLRQKLRNAKKSYGSTLKGQMKLELKNSLKVI
jgi:hypothetical protein